MEDSIYLSQLILNPKNKEVQSDLADCQKMHCRVMKSFPDKLTVEEKAELRTLYRIDFNRHEKKLKLLVQSRIEPDWSRLPKDYLLEPNDKEKNPDCQAIDEIYQNLPVGMRLRFRLRANPTRRISKNNVKQDEKWRGKRIGLRREKDQIDWLKCKAEKSGFQLQSVQINSEIKNLRVAPEAKSIGVRNKETVPEWECRMSFESALFEGVLIITNAKDFRQVLAQGIGSGKAYGFGLLSIAPA